MSSGILYTVITRGTTYLVKFASCPGNFDEVVNTVLANLAPGATKLTYSHGNFLFHYQIAQNITYLCITDDEFDRSRAFLFLAEIQRRFETQYGARALTALPYAMNSEFSRILCGQMRHFSSDNVDVEKMGRVQEQVDELKGIMVKNIDSMVQRGEQLELLVDKTEVLNNNAVSFQRQSRHLARSMWWKNVKLIVIIVAVLIVCIYIIVSISCGGLGWQKCVGK